MGLKRPYYWMDRRCVLRFIFLLLIPSLLLIFFLYDSMVLADRLNNSAISFVLLPCFTRFATWSSEGVRFKYLKDNLRENGEMIASIFD